MIDGSQTGAREPGASRRTASHPAWVELLSVILPAVLGVLLAVLWRQLVPATEHFGDTDEAAAAIDGTLTGLGLIFGILTGGFVLLWPGRYPVLRTLLIVLASTGGGVIAWQLGNHLGSPNLRATGAAFVWPAMTAVVIMVGSILPWTSRRLERSQGGGRPGRAEDPYHQGFQRSAGETGPQVTGG